MNPFFISFKKRVRALPFLGVSLSIIYGLVRKLRGDPRLLIQTIFGLYLKIISDFLKRNSLTGGLITSAGEYYLKMPDGIYLYYNYSLPSLTLGDGQGLALLRAHSRLPLEDFVINFLKGSKVYFDVGANSGYYFALKVAQSNRDVQIYAFEPDPKILHHLRKNININKANSITLFEIALAEECGSFSMTADLGASNFLINQNDLLVNTIEVTVQTLDAFTNQNSIHQIDLIKVDIEGRELDFIKGASATIAKFRPVLLLELNDALLRRGGSSLSDVLIRLKSISYHCYRVKDSNDALCFPSESLNQFLPRDSANWLKEL